ncbi:peptide/nickel transport system permease protein [Microbacterium sp. AG790]|uniref:ABC transporter permease n=1 Tax=Microbacterium sp. AG790 TaxID=2183995 RepID=UPI000EB3EAA5|nr:ABC transporter permease [Microbacterium sp. AG790]RKS94376.1 peptide/nickel transport system permease protein [Microbacterium sp. AG790]
MGFVILKRVAVGIPTLIGVTIILFLTLRVLPGDPISVLLAGAPATPETVDALRVQFGLDESLPAQYWTFLTHAVGFQFGNSYVTRQPVATMIGQQIWPTLQLALAAAAVSALVGILLGSIAAIYRNRWPDSLIRVVSLVNTSMPSFWVGILLIMLFSFTLRWFPATGNQAPGALVLPAITLGLAAAGTVTRLVRNSVIEVMGENFVMALYAKGLRRNVVIMRHVLRNAIIPTVTIVGLQLGALIAGAVIVEAVFARQGLGQMLVQAIAAKDYPVIQAVVFVIAALYILINIIVDISYAYIDPRVRDAVKR